MTDRLFCVCSKSTDLLHLASLLMTVRSLAPVHPAANFARELAAQKGDHLEFAFFGKALVERTKIDHHALMSSDADLFHLVAR